MARARSARWDAPASEWLPSLPSEYTLRQWARLLRERGMTLQEVAQYLGMTSRQRLQYAIGCAGRTREKSPAHVIRVEHERQQARASRTDTIATPRSNGQLLKPIPPQTWQRIADAYGVTVEQLEAVRAAGVTVREWLLAGKPDLSKQ